MAERRAQTSGVDMEEAAAIAPFDMAGSVSLQVRRRMAKVGGKALEDAVCLLLHSDKRPDDGKYVIRKKSVEYGR